MRQAVERAPPAAVDPNKTVREYVTPIPGAGLLPPEKDESGRTKGPHAPFMGQNWLFLVNTNGMVLDTVQTRNGQEPLEILRLKFYCPNLAGSGEATKVVNATFWRQAARAMYLQLQAFTSLQGNPGPGLVLIVVPAKNYMLFQKGAYDLPSTYACMGFRGGVHSEVQGSESVFAFTGDAKPRHFPWRSHVQYVLGSNPADIIDDDPANWIRRAPSAAAAGAAALTVSPFKQEAIVFAN
jgi:hypothetical protein